MPHYQALRSVSDNHVFVICRHGEFYSLPDHVRHQGPWQGMHRGEVERLKPEYRLALARDGYALVRCELAVFQARGVTGGPWYGFARTSLGVHPNCSLKRSEKYERCENPCAYAISPIVRDEWARFISA